MIELVQINLHLADKLSISACFPLGFYLRLLLILLESRIPLANDALNLRIAFDLPRSAHLISPSTPRSFVSSLCTIRLKFGLKGK